MRRRTIILYWLLLTVPAVVLGIGGWILLGHERERLARSDSEAAEERGVLTARELTLSVAELEAELGRRLRESVNAAEPLEALREWERTDPFVRNVFLWRPPNLLTYPDPIQPATQEQSSFVQRYQALLSGRLPWPERAIMEEDLGAVAVPAQQPQERWRGYTQQQQAMPAFAPEPVRRLTWYWENNLHVLLWHRLEPEGRIAGVEVEMAAFLGRVLPALASGQTDRVLQLHDGQGHVMHHTGPPEFAVERDALTLLARVPVGEALPHWSIALYRLPGQSASGEAYHLLSLLVLGIFVAAIVLGGSLLLWQARLQALEARRKATFVSNVSHELKTPLTSIRMYAELLHEGRTHGEEKQRKYLGIIVDEAQRLTRLVNNVLDFSRLDQGRKQYHPRPMQARTLVDDVTATLDMRLEQAGLRLERQDMPMPGPIRADRDACEQVLLNLLDNAIKYAGAGDTLRIETRPARAGGEIAVLDRGPGIPATHQKRIFEAFHRVDESLTSNGAGGTGLGLSIARRLLRDQGGDLRYEPRPGGGAAFIMTLPFATEAERDG